MKNTLVIATILALTGIATPAFSKTASSDPMEKIYFELRTGMTFTEVRNLAERYSPNCKLEDTDIWSYENNDNPYLSWILGMDPKMIPAIGRTGKVRVHRIVLRIDFNKDLKLINAVYVRHTRDLRQGSSAYEKRMALVGNGYYDSPQANIQNVPYRRKLTFRFRF